MRYHDWMPGRPAVAGALALLLPAVSCSSPTGSGPSGGQVRFSLGDDRGDYAASGDLVLEGGRPDAGDWAVGADPDSVGGITVTAFDASDTGQMGDLFILQLHPSRTGVFEPCGPDAACRGRLFVGWKTDFTGFTEWFEVTAGTVAVEELNETHVSGTFTLTARNEGGSGDMELDVFSGTFDVPFDRDVGGYLCGVPPLEGCVN